MEPDGIILNFKHGKIETNWTSPRISFVNLETQGLFLLYNEHLSFSLFSFLDYFLMSFYVLFLHLCVISSVIRFKQVKFTVVKKKNWPASISIWYLRVKEISGIYIYIYIYNIRKYILISLYIYIYIYIYMKNLIELWHNIGLKRGTSWPLNGRAEKKWHTHCLRSCLMTDIKI